MTPARLRCAALAALGLAVAACARPGAPAPEPLSAMPAPENRSSGPDLFEREAGPPAPPPRAIVAGVPFVSWSEAARLWFRERDHANPSSHAAFLMVLGYWGQHWALTEDREAVRQWGMADARRAGSLDELKAFAAAGIPVIVDTALTPIAHPLRVDGPPASPAGVLGPLAALEAHPAATGPARDSLFVAFRVVVGYDDEARQVRLHDPAFGPAVPVGYDDFDRMWAFTDRAYIVMRPWDAEPIVEARRASPSYRPRTTGERAAEDFVAAAALAAIGQPAAARARLEDALRRSDLDADAEHLLRLELAVHRLAAGDAAGARADAERAAWLVPEHHRPWVLLEEVYRRLGLDEAAGAAARRAQKLLECGEAARGGAAGLRPLPEEAYDRIQRMLAEQLARHFFVTTACAGSDTIWLLRPLRSAATEPAPGGGQPR